MTRQQEGLAGIADALLKDPVMSTHMQEHAGWLSPALSALGYDPGLVLPSGDKVIDVVAMMSVSIASSLMAASNVPLDAANPPTFHDMTAVQKLVAKKGAEVVMLAARKFASKGPGSLPDLASFGAALDVLSQLPWEKVPFLTLDWQAFVPVAKARSWPDVVSKLAASGFPDNRKKHAPAETSVAWEKQQIVSGQLTSTDAFELTMPSPMTNAARTASGAVLQVPGFMSQAWLTALDLDLPWADVPWELLPTGVSWKDAAADDDTQLALWIMNAFPCLAGFVQQGGKCVKETAIPVSPVTIQPVQLPWGGFVKPIPGLVTDDGSQGDEDMPPVDEPPPAPPAEESSRAPLIIGGIVIAAIIAGAVVASTSSKKRR